MGIQAGKGKSIPLTQLDHVQIDEFHFTTGKVAPYFVKVSGVFTPYGKPIGEERVYAKPEPTLSIPDLDTFILGLPTADKVKAAVAFTKVQEALGDLYAIYYSATFTGVD